MQKMVATHSTEIMPSLLSCKREWAGSKEEFWA